MSPEGKAVVRWLPFCAGAIAIVVCTVVILASFNPLRSSVLDRAVKDGFLAPEKIEAVLGEIRKGLAERGDGGRIHYSPVAMSAVSISSRDKGGVEERKRVVKLNGLEHCSQIKGVVVIKYEAYTIPDNFRVLFGDSVILEEAGLSDKGELRAPFSGELKDVSIVVNPNGGDDAGTEWNYEAKVTVAGAP